MEKIKEGLERSRQSRGSEAHDDGIFRFKDELKTDGQSLVIEITDVRFAKGE